MKHVAIFRKFLRKTGEDRVAEEKIPEAVKTALVEKYGIDRPTGWVQLHKHLFGAFFEDRAWSKFARFNDLGEWQETMVISANNQLPEIAEAVLDKELGPGYQVLEVRSILRLSQQRFYQVHIELESRHYDCMIDKQEAKLIERRVFDPGEEKLPEAESIDFDEELDA